MSRFHSPRPQFFNSTPTVYAGGTLLFFISETSTPKNVYSDAARSTSIGAELELNSAGYYPGEIFLNEDAAYKVVLEDADGSVVWTADPVASADYSTSAQFQTYDGNPNGNVAGTAGSGTIQSDVLWDRTNSILYVATVSGDAATTVWTAVNASATTPSVPIPQGRLTMTSATPVISANVISGTAVYYALFNGNLVPIYNGTSMVPTEFTELTLTLVASHTANSIYDVFVWSESGVLTLGTGPAWTTATAGSGARGTGAGTTQLARVKGLWTNAVSMTARNGSTTYSVAANRGTYVGSIFMDGTNGQLTCHVVYGQARKMGVWNAYNRKPIILQIGDATASWSYATNTIRQSNGSANNFGSVFCGLAEEYADIDFKQSISATTTENNDWSASLGIGVNSTTAFSGFGCPMSYLQGSTSTDAGAHSWVHQAEHILLPALGLNNINALERGDNAGATGPTFAGGNGNMLMTVKYLG